MPRRDGTDGLDANEQVQLHGGPNPRLSFGRMQPAPNSGFRAIIDREPGAVIVQQSGRVAYANRAFATLLGYEDGAELVGLALRELGRRHLALADATWPEGGPASIKRELRLKRRDGGLIVGECQCEPVELDGQAAHAVFVRDVTEAMRVMEALRRSEQNFRKLIEASPHAMCVCTAKHIEYANPAMVEYLG